MARRKHRVSSSNGLTLADLHRLIAERQEALNALATRREALVREMAEIDSDLGAATGNSARRRSIRQQGRPGPGRTRTFRVKRGRPNKAADARLVKRRARLDSKAKKSVGRPRVAPGTSPLHDVIRSAMRGATAPLKAVDIAKRVLDRGYKSKSKVFHLIIGQRLAEMADVVKPERGLYALKS